MQILKDKLEKLIDSLSKTDSDNIRNRLENLISIYPFNEYEFIISSLLGVEKINFDEYLEIRDEYIARNMYLYISYRVDGKVVRIGEKEGLKMQGFPEWFKFPKDLSNAQAMKQLGNSVAIPAIQTVAEQIIKTLKKYEK